MKKLTLSKKEILLYQQTKDPYLMLDGATELLPGDSYKGYKNFSDDEWFFKVHWPNDPNVPGMLQIESLVQMSSLAILTLPGNKGKIMYLTSANNIKFIKKITPGKKMLIETKVKSYKRGLALCEGVGFVDEEIACKAEFNLILPDEIKKYNLKNKS